MIPPDSSRYISSNGYKATTSDHKHNFLVKNLSWDKP